MEEKIKQKVLRDFNASDVFIDSKGYIYVKQLPQQPQQPLLLTQERDLVWWRSLMGLRLKLERSRVELA